MAVMPVRRLLLNMAWPMMLSMLIQALYNLVDSMFVAQLSSDGFVALALVYPIQTLMIAVCVGTGVGFNALLARRLGEGRPDEANRVVANGYFVYLVCWVVFLVLGVGLAPVFMGLFAPGQPQVIDYGIQYLSIVTGASVGICMQFAGERTLQATGNTVGPMVIQGIGAVINLILDPLLIFGIGPFPRMEVAGAALATVLGQVVGMVVGLCMVRRSSIVRLSFRGFRPDSAIILTMFRVGVPAILVQALATVMNLGMNLILPLFTASGVFILGAYFKLQSFLFMPVNGLNNALIPIVSFNYGARQRSRITGVIHFALVLSAAIMAVGTVVFLAIPGPLLRLFDADAAVLAEGISALLRMRRGVGDPLCRPPGPGGGQFQLGGFPAAPACAPFPAGPAAGRAPALSGVAGLPPVRGRRLPHRPAALPPHRTGPAGRYGGINTPSPPGRKLPLPARFFLLRGILTPLY